MAGRDPRCLGQLGRGSAGRAGRRERGRGGGIVTQRTTVTEPEQALDLRATAIAAADKADRQHQSYQAKRRADNAERARTSAAAILRQRLRVATSAAEWTPIGDPDDDRYRSAAAPVDGLSFLAVERYSSDIGYRSTLYLLRPCPA